MRKLDGRKRLGHKRPKGADIDRPRGYGKLKLRKKVRVLLKRGVSED